MKSLLRFVLLFALIIIGKIAKGPTSLPDVAKTIQAIEDVPVQTASLLRQLRAEPNPPAADSDTWRTPEPVATPAASFQ